MIDIPQHPGLHSGSISSNLSLLKYDRDGGAMSKYCNSEPKCLKDFLNLPADSGPSGLTLQPFQMGILANQL